VINVQRSRHIDATPAAVFAALADPEQLIGLVPRARRVEFIERGTDRARIATYMALGPFGDIRTEGDVSWQTNREIVFRTQRPVLVEARWTLNPTNNGTDLHAELSLDLQPLIGPFAAFVPQENVASMIGPDLDTALAEIARRVERQH
jgi:carbon monoxide dehydrogenase subunit G